MKKPEKPERLYVGARAYRSELSKYFTLTNAGVLVYVRERNGQIKGVLVSEAFANACEHTERLPPEYYAAFFLHHDAAGTIAGVLSRVLPATALQLAQLATELEAKEKKPPRPAKRPTPLPESAPQEEPADLREARIRAEAKAKTKAAIEKRNKEKLEALIDIKPTSPESLSIRHSIKE